MEFGILKSVVLPRRCLLLKRMFHSLCQPATTIKRHTLTSSITRSSDILKRFCSKDLKDDEKTDNEADLKLKFIKLEMSMLREQGAKVPELSFLKPQHWNKLLEFESKSARMSYYNFLFITEKRIENEKMKKQERARCYSAFMEQREENPHITYTLANTAILLKIRDRTMNAWRNDKLRRAMQFGDKLIFDCSYDQYMTQRESKSAADQLKYVFAENRLHKEPFDLHFCNVNYSDKTFVRLASGIPNLRDATFPLNLHEGSYVNLFPKEKLVYLTPHCNNDLTEYDPDSIYIIGAMVDTKNNEPLSLAKAKELNLKMARLPLDRYLNWGAGSGKSLTLDQMTKIMLDLKTHRSWEMTLRHVPRRKIVDETLDERFEVRKWTARVNKFENNFEYEVDHSDQHLIGARPDDQSGLSTAQKFERKVVVSNNVTGNVESKFDRKVDSTLSTADKFKTYFDEYVDELLNK